MKKKSLIFIFLIQNLLITGQNLSHFESIGPMPPDIYKYHFAGNISRLLIIGDSILLCGTNAGGLWRSADNGKSWKCVSDSLPGGINSLIVNPLDSSQIFAVFSMGMNGIYRNIFFSYGIFVSNDTGKTWQIFDFKANPKDGIYIRQIFFNKNNPEKLFVLTDKNLFSIGISDKKKKKLKISAKKSETFRKIAQLDNGNIIIAGNNCLYISDKKFKSWKNILPDFLKKNSLLSVSAYKNTFWVSAFCKTEKQNIIMKFSDFGKTYTIYRHNLMMRHYISEIRTFNDSVIFAGGVYLYYSKDGGKHFTKIRGDIHADYRSIYFTDNQDYTKFYVSTDGGIFYTENLGKKWKNLSNFCVLSIYDFSVENSKNPVIISGLQDNGTLLKDKSGKWKHILGGDGGCSLLGDSLKTMYAQVNRYYYCSKSGNWNSCGIKATYIGGAGIAKSSISDEVVYIPTFSKKTKKSVLIRYSPTNNSKKDIYSNWGFITTIATKKTTPNSEEIFIAHNHKWSNHWKLVKFIFYADSIKYAGEKVLSDTSVAYEKILSISFDSKNGIFLAFDGYNPERKVLYSADDGNSWKNLTYNLPNVPVFKILFIEKFNLLLIGNMYGVYRFKGTYWEHLNALPYMAVTDMEFTEMTDDLYLASYGRGIWKCKITQE